jgi:prepilin-type processing-associated H-X9-DG protein
LLLPYLRREASDEFRCPAHLTYGRYQGSDPAKQGTLVLAARDYSMNGAVGTDPYSSPNFELPVNGPWLDNNHNHVRGKTWRTYARFSDIVAPTPAMLAILFDEDEYSINDAGFQFGMEMPQWIDWPATRHQLAGTVSFADGHVELHHWVDPSTQVAQGNVARKNVPGSPDYQWLWERISARIQP